MPLRNNGDFIITEGREFDPEIESRCCLTRIIGDSFSLHTHEFYEFFLVTSGTATHVANGKNFKLQQGNIVFIRKNDKHGYKNASSGYEHINFSFSQNSLDRFTDFVGSGFDMTSLIESEYPLMVQLTKSDQVNILSKMSELLVSKGLPYSKQELKAKSRYLIAYIFINYFSNFTSTDLNIPLWLKRTYDAMKLPKNFVKGYDYMVEISGRSSEHLSRSFKKHYHISPTNYVLELRLNYAKALLASSALSVTDVCYECGFNSLAWFYKIFTKQCGLSPGKYREKFSYGGGEIN